MKEWLDKYRGAYHTLPQVPHIKKLWLHGYYDGPISGICEVDGQKCWFEQIDEFHDEHGDFDDDDFSPPWWRRYLIHRLTDEQFKAIETKHDKFRRMVGEHCDYDDDGHRKGHFHYTDTITKETVAQFFAESKNEKFPDISPASEDYILGWYEWK